MCERPLETVARALFALCMVVEVETPTRQLTQPRTPKQRAFLFPKCVSMEITVNPQSDLTRGKIESLLRLIDTPEKRRGVLSDLCTLRENLIGLFDYEDSPMRENREQNPLFKILLTANEIIGSLLISGERLRNRGTRFGEVVEVAGITPMAQEAPSLHTSTRLLPIQ